MTTITINRATVEQALEALEDWGSPMALPAVVALRTALAQQAEPVEPVALKPITRLFGTLPVHDTQQAEPVAWAFRHSDGTYHDPSVTEHSAGMVPLYPPPPQRKPLTDEEIDAVWDQWFGAYGLRGPSGPYTRRGFARAVERALEEKNRGR